MIIKNSARCVVCKEEIESTHRHDFAVHYCQMNVLEDEIGQIHFNFAVDGGKEYRRRVGARDGWEDTSTFENRQPYE